MQELTLYNTLTRQKERFVPLDVANVRLYVCGPTVYDFAHIGNARPAIVFDLLFRLLRHVYGHEHVTYVRNITDVDDKINARAARDFPDLALNDAIRRVTEPTAAQYRRDVAALLCLPPTAEPRATEHIGGMIAIIERLLAKGHAYEAAGEVLFRVSSMDDYGQLSGRNLEDNLAGARVAVESHKENAADFVLWKTSGADEPGWDSPWGRGRPGWHIECSAMSERFLGTEFDIHGGGLDLIFPHHENEIAQSRCAHGTELMARVWMHNGFLQVEGQKMSKSLGNFVTINELLETEKFGGRRWPGAVLRLAMLMTHYREPIDFSVRRLEHADGLLESWVRSISANGGVGIGEEARAHWEGLDVYDAEALAYLCDDLNFPGFLKRVNQLSRDVGADAAARLFATLRLAGVLDFDAIRSVSLDEAAAELGLSEPVIEERIVLRLAALAERDFARGDRIRAELAEEGVHLVDYKDPETGEKRTRWEIRR